MTARTMLVSFRQVGDRVECSAECGVHAVDWTMACSPDGGVDFLKLTEDLATAAEMMAEYLDREEAEQVLPMMSGAVH